MSELRGRRFVLGVTGGVAAYKSAELTRLLIKAGALVDVVLSDAGSQFICAATFQALTGRPVWHGLWDPRMANGMAHIDLTRGADAVVIAPATADFIAKLATGRADDLLSTLCLARDCPLHIAPAMNRQMWENPATQRNVAVVRGDGIGVWGPDSGEQACGEVGDGRMIEAEAIFAALHASMQPKLLAGRKVVLTAGPTFEALDPVRGLTNLSSGKMGFALAAACADAGAEVLLVAGPATLPTPYGVQRIDVISAQQMRAAVMAALPSEGRGDAIFIGVAAVADYRPDTSAAHKIKKIATTLTITLAPNPDILAEVAALPSPPFCVGFAAESQNLDEYAQGKRRAKKLGMVVGNLVQDALGKARSKVTLYDERGAHPLPEAEKAVLAQQIVAHMASLLEVRHASC